ncbi:hypothetical protein P20652_3220 [Pseudoalteromonas sp. BSi20652]|uniref:DUF6279 family lipoprotein n=1 Tax=Pseudoalteromonas sp. BSi20652 TaxID=388384 RepID=UPI000231A13B|nr:DUF6279 family lipoprotein [Pseudoalteromonas sp. BSi20652]GAA61343.1 hypothetical protein P20652_3220 [Pseudoalteromonas sp. BSi20652]
MLDDTKMKKITRACLAISMLFLCSCSASFTYNNLSWLSSFWVDDYVDLNKQQNKQLKKIIETTQSWHRSTQLPAYKQDIQNIKTLFNQGINPAQLKVQIVFAKKHWRNLLEHAYLPLAELAVTLTPIQRQEFINNIQEQIDEERDEFYEQTLLARKKERLEAQLEYYKQWLNKLNAEQKTLINLTNEKHQDSGEFWLEYKQRRLNAAKTVLENTSLTQAEFIKQLSTVIKERELYMSQAHLKVNEENLNMYVDLLNSLSITLTEKQRNNINVRFDELIDTLDDIIEG